MAVKLNFTMQNDANGYLLDANAVKGGYGVVDSYNELAGLPAATIVNGSLYFVNSGNQKGFYQYDGSVWQPLVFGGGQASANKLEISGSFSDGLLQNLSETKIPANARVYSIVVTISTPAAADLFDLAIGSETITFVDSSDNTVILDTEETAIYQYDVDISVQNESYLVYNVDSDDLAGTIVVKYTI